MHQELEDFDQGQACNLDVPNYTFLYSEAVKASNHKEKMSKKKNFQDVTMDDELEEFGKEWDEVFKDLPSPQSVYKRTRKRPPANKQNDLPQTPVVASCSTSKTPNLPSDSSPMVSGMPSNLIALDESVDSTIPSTTQETVSNTPSKANDSFRHILSLSQKIGKKKSRKSGFR
jgi:hypothetical protein